MKRILCVLMIILLLIPPMAVSAEGVPSFALGGVAAEGQEPVTEGKIGDTVQLVLSAQNLPDCASMELIFFYDTAVLKPTAYQKGAVSGLFIGNVNYALKDTDGVGQVGGPAVKIAASTSSKTTPLVTGNAALVTLTFEIIGTPANETGGFVSLAKYSLSRMDEDLTKVTGIPLPTAYITVLSDAPVQPQMTGIAVTKEPTKTTYLEGKEAFDPAGGKITVSYDNDTTAEIDLADAEITGFNNTAVGPQELTATYQGFTAKFSVTIKAKSMTGIAVTKAPTKTTYLEGKEAFDPAGGKITVSYDNDTTAEIALSDADISGFNNTVVGPQELTATYQGFTAKFSVTIKAKSITGIAVTKAPTKEIYLEGKEAFDPAGGKITVSYDNDTTVEIDLADAEITGFDHTAVGPQDLTANYQGFTAKFSVTIKAKSMTGIEVTTLPTKTTYLEGKDVFDPAGGKITVSYDNGTTAEIDLAEAEITGFDHTAVGPQELTANYQGFTAKFSVTVKAKSMTGIEVTTLPTKTTYLEGKDVFDPAGGKITVSYDNGTTAEIALSAATVSNFSNATPGERELTVTYAGKTATFKVTIKAKSVVRIALVAPTKRIYWMGEGLDFVGSSAVAYYDNGTSQPLSPASMTRSGFNNRVGGEQTVTLSYGGKSASFTVLVLKNHPFTDVFNNDWYYTNQSVPYVYTKGLMNGMTATTFEAGGFTTRAQLVTILYRLEGQPSLSGDDGFSDVSSADWYYKAVLWASKKGIVSGYPDGTFAPNKPVSRAEMAVIFYRYTKDYKGQSASARADLNVFADRGEIAPWCADAISWAVAEGLMTGMPGNLFDPNGTATRAQIATVLMRYVERNRK